jgi:hypothetical protein
MTTENPSSDPASRWRAVALALAVACVILAATVLVLVLRTAAPASPLPPSVAWIGWVVLRDGYAGPLPPSG